MEEDITIESEITGVEDKIKKVKKQLKECQKEKQEYLNGWQRAKADIINQEKRHKEEMKKRAELSNEELIEKLIPVLESFESAFSNGWDGVDKEWRIGIEYIHSQLKDTLKEFGLEEIRPKVGDNFDVNLHTSVETVKGEEKDKVAEVIRCGYILNGHILRSAKVKTTLKD